MYRLPHIILAIKVPFYESPYSIKMYLSYNSVNCMLRYNMVLMPYAC